MQVPVDNFLLREHAEIIFGGLHLGDKLRQRLE